MTLSTEKATDQDYRLLGLPPGASQDEVKRAYRDLVKLWHPDAHQQRPSNERVRVEEKFKEITGAYRRISLSWKLDGPASRSSRKEDRGYEKAEPAPGPKREGGPQRTGPGPQNGRKADGQTKQARSKAQTSRSWTSPDLTSHSGDVWRLLHSAVTGTAHFFRNHAPRRAFFKLDKRSAATLLFLLLLALVFSLATIPVQTWYNNRIDMQLAESVPQQPPTLVTPGEPAPGPGDGMLSPMEKGIDDDRGSMAFPRPTKPDPLRQAQESTFFTMGSSQAEVLRIQGPPSRVQGQTWAYGLSDVQFREGKVWKYNNFDNSLKVQVLPSVTVQGEPPDYFTLGSERDEVLLVQGTPTRIDSGRWFYGLSEIRFREGRVDEYDNYFGSLKIRLTPSNPSPYILEKQYFTIGSTKDDVLALQGTPTSIQGNCWSYQHSSILFREGKVQHVFNTGGNLLFLPLEELPPRQADSS